MGSGYHPLINNKTFHYNTFLTSTAKFYTLSYLCPVYRLFLHQIALVVWNPLPPLLTNYEVYRDV